LRQDHLRSGIVVRCLDDLGVQRQAGETFVAAHVVLRSEDDVLKVAEGPDLPGSGVGAEGGVMADVVGSEDPAEDLNAELGVVESVYPIPAGVEGALDVRLRSPAWVGDDRQRGVAGHGRIGKVEIAEASRSVPRHGIGRTLLEVGYCLRVQVDVPRVNIEVEVAGATELDRSSVSPTPLRSAARHPLHGAVEGANVGTLRSRKHPVGLLRVVERMQYGRRAHSLCFLQKSREPFQPLRRWPKSRGSVQVLDLPQIPQMSSCQVARMVAGACLPHSIPQSAQTHCG
jgi:hypothetical protein